MPGPLSYEDVQRLSSWATAQPPTTAEKIGKEAKGALGAVKDIALGTLGLASEAAQAVQSPAAAIDLAKRYGRFAKETVSRGVSDVKRTFAEPPPAGQLGPFSIPSLKKTEAAGRAAAVPFELAGLPLTDIGREIAEGAAEPGTGKLGRGLGSAATIVAPTAVRTAQGVARGVRAVRQGRARRAAAAPLKVEVVDVSPTPRPVAGHQALPPPEPPAGVGAASGPTRPRPAPSRTSQPGRAAGPAAEASTVRPEGVVPPNLVINGKKVSRLVIDPKMQRHRLEFEDGSTGFIAHADLTREVQRQTYRGPSTAPAEPVSPPVAAAAPAPPVTPPAAEPRTAAQAAAPVVEPPVIRPVTPPPPPPEPYVPIELAGEGLPASAVGVGRTTKRGGEGVPQIGLDQLGDVEKVELSKMLTALESSEFVKKGFIERERQGGTMDIVGGAGGHPVYWDIVGGTPESGRPIYNYTRRQVEQALREFLTTGKRSVVSDLAVDRLRTVGAHAAQDVPADMQTYATVPPELQAPPTPPSFEGLQPAPQDSGLRVNRVADEGGTIQLGFHRIDTPEHAAQVAKQIESMFPDQRVSVETVQRSPLFNDTKYFFKVSFWTPNGALDYKASKAAKEQFGGHFYEPIAPAEVEPPPGGPPSFEQNVAAELTAMPDDELRSTVESLESVYGSEAAGRPGYELGQRTFELMRQELQRRGGGLSPTSQPPAEPPLGEGMANPESRYTGDELDALLGGAKEEQGRRYAEIKRYEKLIAATPPDQKKKIQRLTDELNAVRQLYDSAYEEVIDAAGWEAAEQLEREIEGAPPAAPADILETGEVQPRLPEAGAVREQNVATPEFEAPFSLTPEAAQPNAVQESLLPPEPPKGFGIDFESRHPRLSRITDETGAIGRMPPQQDVPLPGMDQLDAARAAHRHRKSVSLSERLVNMPRNFVRDYYDRLIDVRRVVDKLRQRGINVPPEADPGVIMDLVAGGTGGPIEAAKWDLLEVRKAAAQEGLATLVTRYLDNRGWDRALTILNEKMNDAFQRGDFARVAELRQKLQNKEAVPLGKGRAELAADLAALQLHPQFAQVKAYADAVFALNRRYWDLAHNVGRYGESLISDAIYQQGVARGPEYIPLERILDIVDEDPNWFGSTRLDLKQRNFLKFLEGSDLPTRDPWEASYLYQARVIKEIGRNEAAASLVNLRTLDPQGIAQAILPVHPGMTVPGGWDSISYYVQGQKKTFAVPKELGNALQLSGPAQMQIIGETMLQFSKSVLQTGAVGANLGFAVVNVPRDILDLRDLSTAVKFYSPKDMVGLLQTWVSSLYHVVKRDQVYREVLRSRALYGTITKQIDPKMALRFDRKPSEYLNVPARVLDAAKFVTSATEEATKVAGFLMLRRQGMGEIRAAAETRRFVGTPDAARKGRKGDLANLLFMFYNVGVQGLGRMPERYRQHPGRLLAVLAEATAIALLLNEWNSQFVDDDGIPSIDKEAPQERNRNYIIETPFQYTTSRGQVKRWAFKFPKNHVRQALGNPIERAISLAMARNSEDADWVQYGLSAASDVTPGSFQFKRGEMAKSLGLGFLAQLNPPVRLAGEIPLNINAYTGAPLVPRREEDISSIEQFGPTTSPTAVFIGQVTGVSPRIVEHIITSSVGGVGEEALTLTDVAMGKGKPQFTVPLEGQEAIARVPLVGPVARRFLTSTHDEHERQQEDRFYRLLATSSEVLRTYNYLSRQGGPGQQRAEAYLEEDPSRRVMYGLHGDLQNISRQLSDIRQQLRLVTTDQSLSGPQKKAQIQELRQAYQQGLAAADIARQLAAAATGAPPAPPQLSAQPAR